ncbi:MAG: hypothetical protein ACLR43_11340 [Faecalibacillus faecis]
MKNLNSKRILCSRSSRKEMYFTLYQDKMIKNKYGIDEPIDKQEINKEFLI